MAEIIRINDNTWRFEDNGVRFFLLTGETEALMIDTGMTAPNAKELAQGLTNLPIKLINTHGDPDHVSGNGAFDEVYMSEAEIENYRDFCKSEARIIPVKEGDIIDLGNRKLKVIDLHGHTMGSIGILDIDARVLFSGDPIQDGKIFMFGKYRNMELYIKSLGDLVEKHGGEFDYIYPSHGSFPVKPELISKLRQAAKDVLNGNICGKNVNFMGQDIVYYDLGFAGFLGEM